MPSTCRATCSSTRSTAPRAACATCWTICSRRARPLVLRQVPIWKEGAAVGFVDLALERAFIYREQATSEVAEIPEDLREREKDARFKMLETLADYDDELLEKLLSDEEPPAEQVFADLSRELAEGLITPVLFGSAEHGNGILRLLKALRHEAPGIAQTTQRLGLADDAPPTAQVLKTFHTAHGGKLSLARVLSGEFPEGATVYGGAGQDSRIAGVLAMMGANTQKLSSAKAGDTVAFAKLETIATGETISTAKGATPQLSPRQPLQGVYGLAISVADRKDEVKLTSAIAKLVEEDPSLSLDHNHDTHEMVLWGQGEMHLRVAIARLGMKFGVKAVTRPRRIAYKETIKKPVTVRGRHKKQTGGHGQFGDVVVEIKPQPRGAGFAFSDTITGGVVPKQYIPAVEAGIREYLEHGPLGFPVIDLAVNLQDGSYHAVDSSEMAFKTAGRIAMTEGLPQCSPVLLEPIVAVDIHVPSEATSKVNQIVSARRGQILGFDSRADWPGWDTVQAHMPESELGDLIVELRSATAGVGTFGFRHERLSELTGRLADQVMRQGRPRRRSERLASRNGTGRLYGFESGAPHCRRTGRGSGATVREVLDAAFAGDAVARSYVLDDQSELRKHMNVFVDGNRVRDRVHLSDPVPADAEVYVIQALSGG
jgi:elongation factor G